MKNSQKGFASIILIVLVVVLAGTLGYVVIGRNIEPTQQSKTSIQNKEPDIILEKNSVMAPISVAQCQKYDSKPVISSVTPSSGPVGTTVEIKGCNFLGFEGDKILWFKNSNGEKAIWNGTSDETTRDSNTVMRVTLPSIICQTMNWYSGLPCGGWLELVPDTYTLYSNSYGGDSNAVKFTITEKSQTSQAEYTAPIITSISPNEGQVGTKVRINGHGWGGGRGDFKVIFEDILTYEKLEYVFGALPPNGTVIDVQPYCPNGELLAEYSGLPVSCKKVEAIKGIYSVYVIDAHLGKSNEIMFRIK